MPSLVPFSESQFFQRQGLCGLSWVTQPTIHFGIKSAECVGRRPLGALGSKSRKESAKVEGGQAPWVFSSPNRS